MRQGKPLHLHGDDGRLPVVSRGSIRRSPKRSPRLHNPVHWIRTGCRAGLGFQGSCASFARPYMYCTAPETQQTAASPAPMELVRHDLRFWKRRSKLFACSDVWNVKKGDKRREWAELLSLKFGSWLGPEDPSYALRNADTSYDFFIFTPGNHVAAPPARYGVPCSVRRRPKDTYLKFRARRFRRTGNRKMP